MPRCYVTAQNDVLHRSHMLHAPATNNCVNNGQLFGTLSIISQSSCYPYDMTGNAAAQGQQQNSCAAMPWRLDWNSFVMLVPISGRKSSREQFDAGARPDSGILFRPRVIRRWWRRRRRRRKRRHDTTERHNATPRVFQFGEAVAPGIQSFKNGRFKWIACQPPASNPESSLDSTAIHRSLDHSFLISLLFLDVCETYRSNNSRMINNATKSATILVVF